jgi:hypothetical protein
MASRKLRLALAGGLTALSVSMTGLPAVAQVYGPAPLFQLPFPCAEVWKGSTRSDHSPNPSSIDFGLTSSPSGQKGTNGSPILAAYSGKVIFAGWDTKSGDEGSPGGTDKKGAGWYVKIDHGTAGYAGWGTSYFHMIARPVVQVNQMVSTGQLLGHVGSIGHSSGPHLHFQQWNGSASNTLPATFNGQPSGVTVGHSQNITSKNCNIYLREPSGAISVVTGGRPFQLTWPEYQELGSPAFADVPGGTFAAMSGTISDGTLVRIPDGSIFIVVGSSKYHLNGSEYAALGNPDFISVPRRLTDGLGSNPQGGLILRDVASSAIYVIAGGVKYWLDGSEYAAMGNPAFVNVPAGLLNRLGNVSQGDVPANYTYLRDVVGGAIYRILNGRKFYLTAAEYSQIGSPAFVNVPPGFLNMIEDGGCDRPTGPTC